MTARNSPTLSIIIPATDRPETLERVLSAVRAGMGPADEVIPVLDPPGASPAYARNAGVADAQGAIVVFVDADVAPNIDALDRIRTAFGSNPSLVGLIGSYDDEPDARNAVSTFRNLLHHHVHQQAAGPVSSFWSGLGAVRRDAFLEAGGFDADNFGAPTVEDIELGLRLTSRGHSIELDPDVMGTHLKRWTLTSMIHTDLVYRGMPWVALLLRTPGSPRVLNLGLRHQLSAVASLAVAQGLTGRPRKLAAGLVALLALNMDLYRLILRKRGPSQAVAGVGLHLIHHLTSVVALPLGLTSFIRKPGTFLVLDRHPALGMRGLHLDEAPPRVPRRRAWTSRPYARARDL